MWGTQHANERPIFVFYIPDVWPTFLVEAHGHQKRWTHWLSTGFDVVEWKKSEIFKEVQRWVAPLVMGWGVIETLQMAAGPIFCPTARQRCVRVAAGHEGMEPRGQENVSFIRLIGTWQRLFGVVKQHQTWNISFLSTSKRHLKADMDSGNKRLTLKNPISSLNCRMTFYLKSFYSSSCLLTCVKVWRSHDAPFNAKRINTRADFFLTKR